MRPRLRSRASFANVTSLIALFVALGGTATALDGSNTVFSDDITNGEVRSADIADGKVNTLDIRDDQVRGPDIADNAAGGPESTLLSDDEILDGSVDGQDVNEGSLDFDIQRVSMDSQDDSSSYKAPRAECPPGKHVIGGGAALLGNEKGVYPNIQTEVAITDITPFRDEVDVAAVELPPGTSRSWQARAIAVCARVAG